MAGSVQAFEQARLALAHGVPSARREEVASFAFDLVDELVSVLLLAHLGAVGPRIVDELRSGTRTLDALRTVSSAWWVWRPSALVEPCSIAPAALAGVVDAATDWVAAFDGSPADALLACHELRLATDRNERRKNGAFYTPRAVADALVDEALRTVTRRPGKPPRILDPACGTGVFLVAAFRRLASAQIDQPMEGSFARRLALAAATLHGVDRDERAVDLTRRAVLLTVLDDPRVHEELALALTFPATAPIRRAVAGIVHGDSLLEHDAPPSTEPGRAPAVDWAHMYSAAIASGGFELVVGNPPFASYGGREAKAIAPELKAHLEVHHGAFRWPSLHGWFLATAARFWGRDTLAFVLPEQVLHLAGYADLRARVAERFDLRRAERLSEGTFSDATAPSAVVVLKRRERDEDVADTARAWLEPVRPRALDAILARGSSLQGFFHDCGIRTTDRRAQVRPVAEATARGDDAWAAALEGKDIGLWTTRAPRVEVRLGAGVFVARVERFDRCTYVLRQTAAYPICSIKPAGLRFRNSLLGLAAPEGARCDLRYVVAFLNSRLGRYLYVALVQESAQRVFPQVKLGALARLPIRFPEGPAERALHDRIVLLVDRRFDAPAGSVEGRQLEAELDAALEDLHGVDAELRQAMVERLESLPAPP